MSTAHISVYTKLFTTLYNVYKTLYTNLYNSDDRIIYRTVYTTFCLKHLTLFKRNTTLDCPHYTQHCLHHLYYILASSLYSTYNVLHISAYIVYTTQQTSLAKLITTLFHTTLQCLMPIHCLHSILLEITQLFICLHYTLHCLYYTLYC